MSVDGKRKKKNRDPSVCEARLTAGSKQNECTFWDKFKMCERGMAKGRMVELSRGLKASQPESLWLRAGHPSQRVVRENLGVGRRRRGLTKWKGEDGKGFATEGTFGGNMKIVHEKPGNCSGLDHSRGVTGNIIVRKKHEKTWPR